ncbi:hypothetical protein DRO66_00245 [Candidatus Bathyarchaeota archaeon]|nr:MAG: hypothetical protein DRO66_00245 [Candidatus Bathyarchaeota archaeon]
MGSIALYEAYELGIIVIGRHQLYGRFYGTVLSVSEGSDFRIGQLIKNSSGTFRLLPSDYSLTLDQKELLTDNVEGA